MSYHFLDVDRFAALRDAGELLEANEVHGNWYGTPRAQVREALVAGRDVILKIDVQGAQVVKENVPDAVLIFIVPPSLESLFQRLKSRATETADQLELRQRNAAIELARQDDYDYIVENRDGEVEATAERIERDPRRRARPPSRIGGSSSDARAGRAGTPACDNRADDDDRRSGADGGRRPSRPSG